jgi:hypothetical protein
VKIRKSKKDRTFIGEDLSVGGSPFLSSCFECGSPLNAGQLYIVDGETVCKNCYETKIPKCKGCGEKHFKKHLKNGLCNECKVYYTLCPNCGSVYDKRVKSEIVIEDKIYCDACISRYLGAKGVSFHGYSHKPRPCFFGEREAEYYFGCEVEMDNSERRNEFMARAECEEVYFKSDGSLGPDGCEVVTHPATLQYHMEEFPWDKVFDAAKSTGFRSHTGSNGKSSSATPTCGLHIHVSKTAFGRTNEERDRREAKLLVLFDKFWAQLTIFSRRDPRSLESWAKRYATFDVSREHLEQIIGKAKSANSGSKHYAVNFGGNSGSTIEFRLFRGTLNKETLLASIQLIDLLIEETKESIDYIQNLTWMQFAEKGCNKYSEFNGYLNRLRSMKRKGAEVYKDKI